MTAPRTDAAVRPSLPATSLFISDLHLEPGASARSRAFLAFLESIARSPAPPALFVLGDLFDAWAGKASLRDAGNRAVIDALRAAADAGIEVTLLRGNRDFLLDARFSGRAGVRIVDEGLAVDLGGRRAFLCHGDHLFSLDRGHQRLRWVLRSCAVRELADVAPARAVLAAARWLRRRSRSHASRPRSAPIAPDAPLAVPAVAAARILRGGFDVLVLGHVHREERRALSIDGREREVFTLGSWDAEGSVLEFDGSRFRFRRFPFPAFASAPDACREGSS